METHGEDWKLPRGEQLLRCVWCYKTSIVTSLYLSHEDLVVRSVMVDSFA